jgi:ketosteroid isomerase-like protein
VKSTNETESEHVLSISDASFDLEDIKIDLFEDIAVTTFYNNYLFTKNNVRVQGKGRVTLVFLNTEEGWKIVHEHSSPFNQ